jgi:hypothetical protein
MARPSSRRTAFLLAASLAALACLMGVTAGHQQRLGIRPKGSTGEAPPRSPLLAGANKSGSCKAACGCHGIQHYGGPIMSAPTKVYLIWFGNWAGKAKTKAIIKDLYNSIATSDLYKVQATYCSLDGKTNAAPRLSVGGATDYTKGYKKGMTLTDAGVEQVVQGVIASGLFGPANPNAVYFVITSADVLQQSNGAGFCSDYCGWHDTFAWTDASGNENMDKCAWTFGFDVTKPANFVNGTVYNLKVGHRDFLIQQDWVNKYSKSLGDGYCGGTHQPFTMG